MSDFQQSLGLCSTCVHVSACAFRIQAGQAVWQCNEFDSHTDHAAPLGDDRERPDEKPDVPDASEPLQTVKGLCVNCEERDNCLRPRSPEGVWHCEEYR